MHVWRKRHNSDWKYFSFLSFFSLSFYISLFIIFFFPFRLLILNSRWFEALSSSEKSVVLHRCFSHRNNFSFRNKWPWALPLFGTPPLSSLSPPNPSLMFLYIIAPFAILISSHTISFLKSSILFNFCPSLLLPTAISSKLQSFITSSPSSPSLVFPMTFYYYWLTFFL